MTLDTTFKDEPYNYANGEPLYNYDHQYHGTVSMYKAIIESYNIPAVKCMEEITPEVGVQQLEKFGFTSILDEPTTGLHSEDVSRLIEMLTRLCDSGNTVVVIEHNLDVIKSADYIIDLGPEGGIGGGEVVAVGTPEMIAGSERSYTGQYLKKVLY